MDGILQKEFSGVRDLQPTADAVKEADPVILFQLFDGQADGRLCHVQLLGSFR